jgi:hypothetical protein
MARQGGAEDIEQLEVLRRYLIFHTKARVPARESTRSTITWRS